MKLKTIISSELLGESMSLTLDVVKQIKGEFQHDYGRLPYSDYINSYGISKVGIQDGHSMDPDKDDLCISIGLSKPMPAHLTLPSTYKGVRVFTKVVGIIRPL